MISKELTWQGLLPDLTPYQALLATSDTLLSSSSFADVQPRLMDGIERFVKEKSQTRFMFIKSDESESYLNTFASVIEPLLTETSSIEGGYRLSDDQSVFLWDSGIQSQFSTQKKIKWREWIEPEQLFGYVSQKQQPIPGLLHKVNGGVLLLTARTLIAQPLLWVRLKQMISQQRFDWLPLSEYYPLPLQIESMPLDIKLIIVGDRLSLEELEYSEPELFGSAPYAEYESIMFFDNEEHLTQWAGFVNAIIQAHKLPKIASDGWPILINQAARYCEDKFSLPLDKSWLLRRLTEASHYQQEQQLTADSFAQALENRLWRHQFLAERGQDDILQEQILIRTEGEVIGQINGLSVLQYPGHPESIGEPSRITCVAHFGDGEFVDIERKAELGGNIHAKGMLIMQAYLNYELKLDQPQPFSASIVFEQSYGEVDGDSASLAELCALISALSLQPIDQQIAVTGAVDQFGFVQPIGGVNDKIEGFFDICFQRELTGQQGVIIPMANVRHLSLKNEVIEAVKANKFHIWPVEHAAQAVMLLTRMPFYEEEGTEENGHLLALIQDRINLMNNHDKPKFPWFLRWLG